MYRACHPQEAAAADDDTADILEEEGEEKEKFVLIQTDRTDWTGLPTVRPRKRDTLFIDTTYKNCISSHQIRTGGRTPLHRVCVFVILRECVAGRLNKKTMTTKPAQREREKYQRVISECRF
jgi:hypothetical protein